MKKQAPSKTLHRPALKRALGREQILEVADDMIATNCYIKIGLTRSQVRAITRLGKRWSIRESPCATMARYLISLSLLDLEGTQAKLVALVRYIEAEGFHTLGHYCDHVMRRQERLAQK